MKLQKLFVVCVFFFLLPSLGKAQQSSIIYPGCTEVDKTEIVAALMAAAPFEGEVFGATPNLKSVACTDYEALYLGNGSVKILRYSGDRMAFRRILYHEISHVGAEGTVFFAPAQEGLAEYGSLKLLELTQTPTTPERSPKKRIQDLVRGMGTYSECRRFLEHAHGFNYELAMAPFLWIDAANQGLNWASGNMIGRSYKALRDVGWIPFDPSGLEQSIHVMASASPTTVDGQTAEQWLLAHIRNVQNVPSEEPAFEVITQNGNGPSAVNPTQFQVVQFFHNFPPKEGWPGDFTTSFLFPKRVYISKVVKIEILDWTGKVVYETKTTGMQVPNLPPLPQGGYTIRVVDGTSPTVLHRNHFVVWDGEGTVAIKINRKGEVREFSMEQVDRRNVLLHNGEGFAAIDPECKVLQCNLGFRVAGGEVQTFTLVAPGDQIVRVHETQAPPRSRRR